MACLVPPQISDWIHNSVWKKRSLALQHGQRVSSELYVHTGYLGRPANSGDRQVIVTTNELDNGQWAYQTCWAWWTWCEERVDKAGWRMCAVRQFSHRF